MVNSSNSHAVRGFNQPSNCSAGSFAFLTESATWSKAKPLIKVFKAKCLYLRNLKLGSKIAPTLCRGHYLVYHIALPTQP